MSPMRYAAPILIAMALAAPGALAQEAPGPDPHRPATEVEPREGRSLAYKIAVFLPNRVLDLLDPVRVRVRVGPGFAGSVRATELADVFLGSYASLYAGLPGPRQRRLPRLPIGVEALAGLELGPADLSTGLGGGPDYSSTEFGLGFHVALVGIDVGIDPLEIIDIPIGWLGFTLREDDF